MEIEFIDCGECAGCKAKAQIAKIVAEIDSIFIPRLEAISARWNERQYHDEQIERDISKQLNALVEERSSWIRYVTEPLLRLGVCCRIILKATK